MQSERFSMKNYKKRSIFLEDISLCFHHKCAYTFKKFHSGLGTFIFFKITVISHDKNYFKSLKLYNKNSEKKYVYFSTRF